MTGFRIKACSFIRELWASDEVVKHCFVVLTVAGASGGVDFADSEKVGFQRGVACPELE